MKKFLLTALAATVAAAPIAAGAVSRPAAPIQGESTLGGQGTIYFLAGIAFVALAVVLLPEDQPASP